MNLDEIENEVINETTMTWAKRGGKLVRKYRCSSGPRKGRIVANPRQCNAPIDVKKRISLKRTKARLGPKMARKARKTKKFNPVSKRVKMLNKPNRRRR